MGSRLQGQPLVVFAAVLAGWFGGRVATLDPVSVFSAWASPPVMRPALGGERGRARLLIGPQSYPLVYPSRLMDVGAGDRVLPAPQGRIDLSELVAALLDYGVRAKSGRTEGYGEPGSVRHVSSDASGFFLSPGQAGFAPGDIMPPGYAGLPGIHANGEQVAAAAPHTVPDQAGEATGMGKPRRWSADGWVLIRNAADQGLTAGTLPATYGGSQAGAVLRYAIFPRSPLRPGLYMRTTSAMGEIQESAAALGISLRPGRSLPLRAALEGRLTNGTGGNRLQPVAMVTSELAPIDLPRGLRAEAYGQGGYVAGRYATAFADGQVRLDKELVRVGNLDARLGAGVWGGAQKGAARLDAGPSAMVTMPLGKRYFGRVALDWRFRLAGEAEPGSGPALTLSAGF